jgi:hypothetical protein
MPTRDEALALLTAPGSPFEIAEEEVWDQRLRVFSNAPRSLRAVWESTSQHGDIPFLVYHDERITFTQAHATCVGSRIVCRWPASRRATALRSGCATIRSG